jgi:KUP system potassium uptake protein
VSGTAIFMARDPDHIPTALLHALKHYKVLHERNVLMTVETEDVPHVLEEDRLQIREIGAGFYAIGVRYGFMEQPNLVRALAQCRRQNFRFNLMETSFVIGREKLLAGKTRSAWARWRLQLFILMSNTALDATEFFRIPPNRAIELGGQVEI